MTSLIVIPDAATSPRGWKPMADLWATKGRCAVFDHRELGSVGDMAQSLLDSTRGKLVAYGQGDLGGAVALEVARIAPDRITGLVLANARADAAEPREWAARMTALKKGPAHFSDPARHVEMLSPFSRGVPAVLDRLQAAGDHKEDFDVVVRHELALMERPDARHVLPRLKNTPVLIIGGGSDRVTPVAHQIEIFRLAPLGRLETMFQWGHLPHIEQPLRTARLVQDIVGHASPAPAFAPVARREVQPAAVTPRPIALSA